MPGVPLSKIQIECVEKQPFLKKRKKGILFLGSVLLVLGLLLVKGEEQTPCLNLPSIHFDFLGRQEEMAFLKSALLKKREGRKGNLIAISGEGGIGKTELAIAFANRNLSQFSLVGWMDGSHEEALSRSYISLGDFLGVQDANLGALKKKIHVELENRKGKPWLLVIDDVQSLPRELPRMGGHILVTSRDKGICFSNHVLELSKKYQDNIDLLSKITGEKESETLRLLIDQLDNLPLLINYVGHYVLATPGIGIAEYQSSLKEILGTEVSPLRGISKRYSRSLAATYKITLKRLEEKASHSLQFLKDAIFLRPSNIPVSFLSHWIKEQSDFNDGQIILAKGDILRELTNHSLIRYDAQSQSFSISRLLQQALLSESVKDRERILKTLLTYEAVVNYNPTCKAALRPFQQMLPHCMNVLDHIEVPTVYSTRLSLILARYFLDAEVNSDKAEKYLCLAEKWKPSERHPLQGRTYFLKGLAAYRKEMASLQAYRDFKKGGEIFESCQDPTSYVQVEQNPTKCNRAYQRAICLQYQGQVLSALGRLDESEMVLGQALEVFQAVAGGEDHFDIARILREQGVLLSKKGDIEGAIDKVKEALRMQKRVYQERFDSQPTAAATYRALGDLLQKRGDYSEADKVYAAAIKINHTVYQTKVHCYLAELYLKRAAALQAHGKSSLAKKMKNKAQAMQKQLNKEGT